MLTIISCRNRAIDPDSFGATCMVGEMAPFAGGPIGQTIMVHGYNVTEDRVKEVYSHFAGQMEQDCIGYSWPGGDHAIEFLSAVGRADVAGWRLRDLLTIRRVARISSIGPDNIVTHSLGARVALRALTDPYQEIHKLVLMGAAVDYDCFSPGREFSSVPSNCKEIHLICSKNDPVLRDIFPIGDIGGDHVALGSVGPKTRSDIAGNIIVHDLSDVIHDHGDYLTRPECIKLVSSIIGPKA